MEISSKFGAIVTHILRNVDGKISWFDPIGTWHCWGRSQRKIQIEEARFVRKWLIFSRETIVFNKYLMKKGFTLIHEGL